MNRTGNIMGYLIIAAAVGLIGCTQQNMRSSESELDKNWGRSFESAKYHQIINLESENNLAPVEGLDGPVAEKVINDHLTGQGSITPPASQSTF
jgi:hypothetical protein